MYVTSLGIHLIEVVGDFLQTEFEAGLCLQLKKTMRLGLPVLPLRTSMSIKTKLIRVAASTQVVMCRRERPVPAELQVGAVGRRGGSLEAAGALR